MNGFRFRRQHPIDEFIIDFFCYEAKLVIELDGDVHMASVQMERDIERTRILNRHDLFVIRFKNEEVEKNIKYVINQIKKELLESKKT